MKQEQFNAIKERVTKAEEGTWYLGKKSPNGLNNIGVKGCMIGQVFDDGDAVFIAHAREDVPALIAEVERLREALEQVMETEAPIMEGWETSTYKIARQALGGEVHE